MRNSSYHWLHKGLKASLDYKRPSLKEKRAEGFGLLKRYVGGKGVGGGGAGGEVMCVYNLQEPVLSFYHKFQFQLHQVWVAVTFTTELSQSPLSATPPPPSSSKGLADGQK